MAFRPGFGGFGGRPAITFCPWSFCQVATEAERATGTTRPRHAPPPRPFRGTIDPVTTPTPTAAADPAPTPPGLTHGCLRCGAPVDIDTALCERCNPLGLKDPAASQAHGTIFIGVLVAVVLLAVFARMTVSGVGPFQASVVAAAAPAGTALAVTLTVTNTGTATGATTCRVTDPKDRNGGSGAIVLSPRIDPKATVTFTQEVTELGGTVRDLAVECAAP